VAAAALCRSTALASWPSEYPTEKAFERLQSSVNKRADMVGPAIIDWSNPHLYGAGTLIVVYLGKKPLAMRTLEKLLDPIWRLVALQRLEFVHRTSGHSQMSEPKRSEIRC